MTQTQFPFQILALRENHNSTPLLEKHPAVPPLYYEAQELDGNDILLSEFRSSRAFTGLLQDLIFAWIEVFGLHTFWPLMMLLGFVKRPVIHIPHLAPSLRKLYGISLFTEPF